MDEERISQLLRSLPREEASPYFTAGVLRRLREGESPRRRIPRRVLAAVAAVLVLALAFGAREGWHRYQLRQSRARLAALRAEHEALNTELRALRELAAEARPVVYLGSRGDVDLVVDLARLARQRRQRTARPALVTPRESLQPIPSTYPHGERRL